MSGNFSAWMAANPGPLAIRFASKRPAARFYATAGEPFLADGVDALREAFGSLNGRKVFSEDAGQMDRDHGDLLAELGWPRIYCGGTVDRVLAAAKDKPAPLPGQPLAALLAAHHASSSKAHRAAAMLVESEDLIWREATRRGSLVDVRALTKERARHTRVIEAFARTGVEIRRESAWKRNGTAVNAARDTAQAAWLTAIGVRFDATSDAKWGEPSRCDSSGVSAENAAAWTAYDLAYQSLHRLSPLNQVHKSVGQDGRVHPLIKTNRAVTGRVAVSSPGLQNLPAKRQGTRHVIVPDPGFDFVSVDHSNAELRVVARYIDDPGFTARVTGGDLYQDIADVSGLSRGEQKWHTIAFMYAMKERTLAKEIGAEKAAASHAAIRAVVPEITAFFEEMTARAATGERFETLFGRPLPRLTGETFETRHELQTNLLVQGSARDAWGLATRRAVTAGLIPSIPLHDELFVLSPKGHSEATVETLMAAMTVDLGHGVVLTGKPRVSHRHWV